MFERRIRRGRLFGQYGGVGVIAKRYRPTLMRKGPHHRSNIRPKSQRSTAPKVLKATKQQVHKRRMPRKRTPRQRAPRQRAPRQRAPRKRAPKKVGLHSLIAEGKEALKEGLTQGKKSLNRGIKRTMQNMPMTMVEVGKAAGEAVAPTVAKAGSKGLKNVRKRFVVDKTMISPAQLPIKRVPKLTGRRRLNYRTNMPSHVTNMSIKRGGYLF